MNSPPRTIRRPKDVRAPSANVSMDDLVINLPDPRLLFVIARSVLLAAAVLSLPWIRTALLSHSEEEITAHVTGSAKDEMFYLPKLVQDMRTYGLLQPQRRALFVGNPGIHALLLRRNSVSHLPEGKIPAIADRSMDFLFLLNGGFSNAQLVLTDRVLRVGGIAAIRLGSDPMKRFNLPANYRIVYIRNIGFTILAVKKLYHDNGADVRQARRLLSLSMSKKGELRALEDLLLEPPVEKNDIRRPRYLPKLTGDSLDKYPRRIFVDFGSRGRIGAENWFLRNYPKSRKKFEMARVDLVGMPVLAGGGVGGVADWLTMNAREEDFVVVKAEEEAVVDLVNGKAIGLVDELFLECSSQWGSEKNVEDETRRNTPYWACLALLGKLREDGIAVHQWWDLNKQWK